MMVRRSNEAHIADLDRQNRELARANAELKTMQEVITLLVFAGFSVLYLGEKLTLNHGIGFALICAGAWFVFQGK